MKKLICMLLAVTLLLPLAACGGSGSSDTGVYYFAEYYDSDGWDISDFDYEDQEYMRSTRLEIKANNKAVLYEDGESIKCEYNSTSIWYTDYPDDIFSFSLNNGVATVTLRDKNWDGSEYWEKYIYRKK